MADCSSSKALLRTHYLEKRRAIGKEDRARWMAAFTRNLLDHIASLRLLPRAVIAGYAPIKGEIDVFPALADLAEQGFKTALPVVSPPPLRGRTRGNAERVGGIAPLPAPPYPLPQGEGELLFRSWKPGDALIQDAFGVPCPSQSAPFLTPAVILTPLLAFDRAGHRLGYGKGYYDRTINSLRDYNHKLHCLGAAFALQEHPLLPAHEGDQKLDAVITENGL